MAAAAKPQCAFRESAEALAHDRLAPAERNVVHQHLVTCETCRAHFRRITGGWLPHVPNYTVLEQVGKGGFGAVYKAIHHTKQRFEALKVHFGNTPLRYQLFENEVRLIARLEHPNIATLYEAKLGGKPPYYAMQFVEGQQLGDYFKSHALPLERRIDIVRTIVRAIGYAHGERVIHRDIKPANILIDAAGAPRIVDFGIGKMLGLKDPYEELESQGSPEAAEGPVGTFGFSAPEQLANGQPSVMSDIYALGALLFYCVTGYPAKWATRDDHLLRVLREREVSRPNDLARIITRCVRTNPSERYQSCAELDRDLRKYLVGWPIAPYPSPGYALVRCMAYALRHHPFAVRAPLLTAVAFLLAMFWSWRDLRYFASPASDNDVKLVTICESTYDAAADGSLDAPGLSRQDKPSSRVLLTRLLERLAPVGPRVIVIDHYFRKPRPELDGPFTAAIRNAGAPVVIGASKFDQNWTPVGAVDEITNAVHTVALPVARDPKSLPQEYVVPLVVARGAGPPIAAFGLAGYAAWRFPDCAAAYSIIGPTIEVRYKRLHPQAGEAHWRSEIDTFPVREVEEPLILNPASPLNAGDRIYSASIKDLDASYWDSRTIRIEDALRADDAQLRSWFSGKAVVIGTTIGEADRFALAGGKQIYGCQINALSLQTMLARSLPVKLERPQIALRAFGWSLAAGALALAARRRIGRAPLPSTLIAMATLALLGLIGAGTVGWISPDRTAMDLGVMLSTLLVAGGAAAALEALRERQLRLAPKFDWSALEPALSTTLLANPTAVTRSDDAVP